MPFCSSLTTSPPTPEMALLFEPEKWSYLPTQTQHTSTSPNLAAALAPTSCCQKTSQYQPTTAPYSPFLKSLEMSCRQPLKPNWRDFSSVPRKWSLSGQLSVKWAGHSQNHPFSVTTQLPWEWPIKPSFHEKPSRWICNSTGFAAEAHKTNPDTSGIQDTKILKTTAPRNNLQYITSLSGKSDKLHFTSQGWLKFIKHFTRLTARVCRHGVMLHVELSH